MTPDRHFFYRIFVLPPSGTNVLFADVLGRCRLTLDRAGEITPHLPLLQSPARLSFTPPLCYVASVSELFGRRVSLLFAFLSSCSESTVSDKASRENAGEDAAYPVEDTADELTEPSTSTPAASSAREPTQNSSTSPATGSSAMVPQTLLRRRRVWRSSRRAATPSMRPLPLPPPSVSSSR